jgi:hypothetical protein
MHLALNIATFGMLSLYLNKKKENAERKHQALIADILCQQQESEKQQQHEADAKLLKEQQEAEQQRQLEIKKAERKAETLRFNEAEKQKDLDFSTDPRQFIKDNFEWVNQLLTYPNARTLRYTHYFGCDRSWTQCISIPCEYTEMQALNSRAFCIKMESQMDSQILSNGDAYVIYQ